MTANQQASITEKFAIRPATLDDVAAYHPLYSKYMVETHGQCNMTVEEVKDEWDVPNFDMSESTLAVFTPEGQFIGNVEIWDNFDKPVNPYMFGYVDPDFRGQGIGTHLMQWAEERAKKVFDRVAEEARVVLRTHSLSTNTTQKELLENHGLVAVRSSLTMLIEMDEAPPAPVWPEGVSITTYAEKPDMRTFMAAFREAWRDHRGYIDRPLQDTIDEWQHVIDTDPHFDPNTWWLVMEDENLAAVLLGWPVSQDDPDKGVVEVLGVLRNYRRKGLGLALLQQFFGELWKRGIRKADLSVDGSSLTGANLLYERAGMHIHQIHNAYEKELRPGKELTKQSIE